MKATTSRIPVLEGSSRRAWHAEVKNGRVPWRNGRSRQEEEDHLIYLQETIRTDMNTFKVNSKTYRVMFESFKSPVQGKRYCTCDGLCLRHSKREVKLSTLNVCTLPSSHLQPLLCFTVPWATTLGIYSGF